MLHQRMLHQHMLHQSNATPDASHARTAMCLAASGSMGSLGKRCIKGMHMHPVSQPIEGITLRAVINKQQTTDNKQHNHSSTARVNEQKGSPLTGVAVPTGNL
jgi:hypothetical protein